MFRIFLRVAPTGPPPHSTQRRGSYVGEARYPPRSAILRITGTALGAAPPPLNTLTSPIQRPRNSSRALRFRLPRTWTLRCVPLPMLSPLGDALLPESAFNISLN